VEGNWKRSFHNHPFLSGGVNGFVWVQEFQR
jgi:hypothetical protein